MVVLPPLDEHKGPTHWPSTHLILHQSFSATRFWWLSALSVMNLISLMSSQCALCCSSSLEPLKAPSSSPSATWTCVLGCRHLPNIQYFAYLTYLTFAYLLFTNWRFTQPADHYPNPNSTTSSSCIISKLKKKLLWNCSEIALKLVPKLLWICSKTALKPL